MATQILEAVVRGYFDPLTQIGRVGNVCVRLLETLLGNPIGDKSWRSPLSSFRNHPGAFRLGEKGKWSERQDSNLSIRRKNKGKWKHDAQRDAQKLVPSIAEVKQVIMAWPKLPAPLKAAILAIINSVEVLH